MTVSRPRKGTNVWMSGDYKHKDLKFERATVEERLSTLTKTQIQFVARKTPMNLNEMVGNVLTVHVGLDDDDEKGRMFTGTCVSVEAVASTDREDTLIAEVRPWFWMLTLTRNNRVFQNLSVLEIIEQVLDDHGQKAFLKISTSGSYEQREYCVQYRESDFAFLSRLMEEEGLFYYFDHSEAFMKNEKLVICDGTAGLGDLGGDDQISFWLDGQMTGQKESNILEWSEKEAVVPGKVSLGDYDFEVPSVDQMAVSLDKRGKHGHNAYEYYDLPGHYRKEQNRGKTLAAVRLGADTARFKEFQGLGNVRAMATGHAFKLDQHPDEKFNIDYLVTGAKHFIADVFDSSNRVRGLWLPALKNMDVIENEYQFEITTIKKEEQFRAPMLTPWPEVPGVQTGLVVGPSDKEIWTDKHGRIKVHFRWDRVNPKDDTASCWIRVATGWAGTNWGLNSVPRVGQEVLIQFEDGDPDRPIVTGMLYNADNMPPYVDPGQPTRTGLMTRSSPNGGAKDFNALVFEDKAGSEYMNVQAQKDYQFVVKDSAEIIIGDDGKNVNPSGQSADASSLKQTVKKNVTELVQEGDKSETVDKGDYELIVEGDRKETVRSGNMSLDVNKGNISVDAKMGKIDVSAAKTITMEAMQKITLKVGGSSIEITPTGVQIKGMAMAKVEAPMVTGQASGILTLSGSLTKIN